MTEVTAAMTAGTRLTTRDVVTVKLPAASAYLSVLRTATAGLAVRLDFTIDEIEDLRIAVDEACAMLLAQAVPGTDLVCEFELTGDAMRIAVSVLTVDGRVESNGNFHGAPVAYVLDFLAIPAADVASMSERRTDRMLDVARSRGLPPFLADDPGVDSGHMIAQYTQAGIVSELKRLANPASVDSIPSSAMQEDHVSMGWAAARKLRRAVDGLTRVLAVEVLTAARALDLRAPLEPSPATGAVIALLRSSGVPGPGPDRFLAPEIEQVVGLVRTGAVVAAAEAVLGEMR